MTWPEVLSVNEDRGIGFEDQELDRLMDQIIDENIEALLQLSE